MTADPSIAVVIAAYNAQATIATAVRSALRSDAVAEVVVVNDCSTDDTADVARQAGASDPRLSVLEQPHNQGPAAARNRAITTSSAPFITMLDADDVLLPGRFDHIFATEDWDLCADNILFFRDHDDLQRASDYALPDGLVPSELSFERFVNGNLTPRNQTRGELGFLKPVIRRALLETLDLAYLPQCRLGEDFILYVTALAHGARFRIVPQCGYAALIRDDSLSGNHGVAELRALYEAELHLLQQLPLGRQERRSLCHHAASVRRKMVHREVLLTRRAEGVVRGAMAAGRQPSAIVDILSDWIGPAKGAGATPRRLLNSDDFSQLRG